MATATNHVQYILEQKKKMNEIFPGDMPLGVEQPPEAVVPIPDSKKAVC